MFETTLRYKNLNNKDSVETQTQHYDSLLIQAHMLAYGSKQIPLNISNLVEEHGVEYYIDPMISDFRVGNDFRSNGGLRGWHSKYVDVLGDPLQRILKENANVNARHVSDSDLRKISQSVVQFQEDFIPTQVEEEAGRYDSVNTESLQPKAVIPWSHKIQNKRDIQANRDIIEYSQEQAENSLKPCLFVTPGFIQRPGNRAELIKLLSNFDVSQCFLWIEGLDKHETLESVYKNAVDLVYDLSESRIDPHFYYGDHFSNLLSYFGLSGTAYGTLYSEERSEQREKAGEGGVQQRFYVEPLRDFLKVTAAVDLMVDTTTPMCGCKYCSRHFDSWNELLLRLQSDDDDDVLLPILQKHAVAMKWRNARYVEEHDIDEAIENLEDTFKKYVSAYRNSPLISPRKSPNYLASWKHVLEVKKDEFL